MVASELFSKKQTFNLNGFNRCVSFSDLRMAFIMMDSDNDGRVTAAEIQSMLSRLGIVIGEEIVLNLVRQASQSGEIFKRTG